MSDHIPDVTKMIGETPRTDQQNDDLLNSDSYTSWLEISGFARQLERELNAANERIKNLESALSTVENINKVNAYQDLESANERIKRLEQAGDRMFRMLEHDGFESVGQNMWKQSKEAKP